MAIWRKTRLPKPHAKERGPEDCTKKSRQQKVGVVKLVSFTLCGETSILRSPGEQEGKMDQIQILVWPHSRTLTIQH